MVAEETHSIIVEIPAMREGSEREAHHVGLFVRAAAALDR